MGGDNNSPSTSDTYAAAKRAYQKTEQPSELETQFQGTIPGYQDAAVKARDTQMADYGNIMGGYKDYMANIGGPTNFSYNKVTAPRPGELDESYGYLREAAPGYREFAQTGGYSPTDIQELRARGISPIRSAYGTTIRELDRARSLGGPGGAPNYIAALSRANRELPGQMADATTNVNAQLAQDIREGKLAGLGGLANIGGTMGGLSSSEAGRMLQAELANQQADLTAQQASEGSRWNVSNANLAGLSGRTSLYGTSPAMAATFGNQALNAWGTSLGSESARLNRGIGLIDSQLRASAQDSATKQGYANMAMQGLGSAASYIPRNDGQAANYGNFNNSMYTGGVGQEPWNPDDANWLGGSGYDPTGNYGGSQGWVNGPGINGIDFGGVDPNTLSGFDGYTGDGYFDPSLYSQGDPSVPPPSDGWGDDGWW